MSFLFMPIMLIIFFGIFAGTLMLAKRIFKKANGWITIASAICAFLLFAVASYYLNLKLDQIPWFVNSMTWH